MTFLLATLLSLMLAVVLIPVLLLLLQTLLAAARLGAPPAAAGRRPRVAILVPAHNEEAGVGATIASLQPQLLEGDRILVVADNCSDDTAGAVRRAGAEARERFDTERRGKGYALDFGVRCLEADAPEVVIIVDADCIAAPGAIDRLAREALASGRPVQALYLMDMPAGGGLMKKIGQFAWVVKNLVRPLGYHRLGLPCQLMGTGMAFSWPMISQAALASGHIVEDMKLGMDLALAGKAPLFSPHALVTSSFAASAEGADSQRTRWEHGHMSMIASEALPLLLRGLLRGRIMVVALALDMCVPPLALLALIAMALSAVALVFSLFTGAGLPLLLALMTMAGFGAAVLLAWARHGRGILSAGDLLMAVFYIFKKIPLYCRFFINRQVEWVRSKRDSE